MLPPSRPSRSSVGDAENPPRRRARLRQWWTLRRPSASVRNRPRKFLARRTRICVNARPVRRNRRPRRVPEPARPAPARKGQMARRPHAGKTAATLIAPAARHSKGIAATADLATAAGVPGKTSRGSNRATNSTAILKKENLGSSIRHRVVAVAAGVVAVGGLQRSTQAARAFLQAQDLWPAPARPRY